LPERASGALDRITAINAVKLSGKSQAINVVRQSIPAQGNAHDRQAIALCYRGRTISRTIVAETATSTKLRRRGSISPRARARVRADTNVLAIKVIDVHTRVRARRRLSARALAGIGAQPGQQVPQRPRPELSSNRIVNAIARRWHAPRYDIKATVIADNRSPLFRFASTAENPCGSLTEPAPRLPIPRAFYVRRLVKENAK